jgi:hypothetical protein
MSSATGPVRPTPANLHPTIDYCVQLTLPNDREWIGAFYDALYQLTYWFAWQRDAAHTGKDIAAIWLTVLANMRPCSPVKALLMACTGVPYLTCHCALPLPGNPAEVQNSRQRAAGRRVTTSANQPINRRLFLLS